MRSTVRLDGLDKMEDGGIAHHVEKTSDNGDRG
jgi:hypothetical protein